MKTKKDDKLASRAPIVTVLGHVDHGKTTLLDAIRNTNFQKKEAGGITQSIGASVVRTKEGRDITFIDTPGHAAFQNMRSRGAKLADIVILVVAADDGPKPQTIEAIKYIKEVEVPIVVALTKIDLPTANIEAVKSQLEKEGVLLEGRGGDTPVVEVSAKAEKGIDDLLDIVLLMSELNELKGDKKGLFEGYVVETTKDRRGSLATVVVKDGTLKTGQELSTDTVSAKVKGIFDWRGESVKEVLPGYPGVILGFTDLPEVGSKITQGKFAPKEEKKSEKMDATKGLVNVLVKAANAGSLEAVIANMPEKVNVLAASVGDPTESDIFFAKTSNAIVMVFESKVATSIRQLAQTEGVKIFEFNIIYELFEKAEELVEKRSVKVLGEAKIMAKFPFDGKTVAGCRVTEGEISKNDQLILVRGEDEVGNVKIISLKKQKNEAPSVRKGEECGMLFSPQLDFKVGDVLLSVRKPSA